MTSRTMFNRCWPGIQIVPAGSARAQMTARSRWRIEERERSADRRDATAVNQSGARQSADVLAPAAGAPYCFLSSRFRILPVPVFGKLSRNSTDWGHL